MKKTVFILGLVAALTFAVEIARGEDSDGYYEPEIWDYDGDDNIQGLGGWDKIWSDDYYTKNREDRTREAGIDNSQIIESSGVNHAKLSKKAMFGICTVHITNYLDAEDEGEDVEIEDIPCFCQEVCDEIVSAYDDVFLLVAPDGESQVTVCKNLNAMCNPFTHYKYYKKLNRKPKKNMDSFFDAWRGYFGG